MPMPYISFPEPKPEWHSVSTIKLSQLKEWGFWNPEEPEWEWDYYNREQYERLCSKFFARYADREIGILPPGEWRRSYIRKLNEIMPKYKLLYEAAEDMNILQTGREYHKSREIGSDFPQTQLAGRQDYASTGKDLEYETIHEGNPVEQIADAADRYRDIDVMILDELEVLFSALVSVSLNLW